MPFVLNVVGPRESKARGIQKRTRKFLAEVLGGMLFRAREFGIVIDDFFANLYSLAINWVIYLVLFR